MSGPRLAIIANVPPDIKHHQHDDNEKDYDIQTMEDGTERIQVVAQLVPNVGQYQAPGQRTQESVEDKFHKWHLRDTGR